MTQGIADISNYNIASRACKIAQLDKKYFSDYPNSVFN
jgi:hypothetical protein